MAKRKQPEKPERRPKRTSFEGLEKRLQDPKYTERVKQNILLKRRAKTLDVRISKLEAMLPKAKPEKRKEIEKMLAKLRKARKSLENLFYRK